MNRPQLVLVGASLAMPVLAQTNHFVVPRKALTTQPGAIWYDAAPQFYPLWGSTGTTVFSCAQYLYDVSEIPAASALLQAVSFRSPHNYQQQAATYQTTVLVSESMVAPGSASGTFASNHGANGTTVFTSIPVRISCHAVLYAASLSV